MRATKGDQREGQQVAVNLERKRAIIHLEENCDSVYHSPGSTKLSRTPEGGKKKKHTGGVQTKIHNYSHLEFMDCSNEIINYSVV